MIHIDDSDSIELYNGTIFNIRDQYNQVFPQFGKQDEILKKINEDKTKVFKIRYTLNVLPSIDEHDDSLMNALGETEEITIFSSKVIRDLLEFRWNLYAGKFHYIGLGIHTFYVFIFNIYCSFFI